MNTARRILGTVISGGRLYRAGDEEALARRLRGRSVAHLVASGTIAGDWPMPADTTPTPILPTAAELEEMVKADLVTFAADLGLVLDAKLTKAEMLAAITAHRATSEGTNPTDGENGANGGTPS